ncbi:hypothetical protein GN956_G3828 [Arapaima gigas]
MFVSLAGRFVTVVMMCAKWTMVFVHHTVTAFDTLHAYLHWWSRRGSGLAVEMCPGPGSDSADAAVRLREAMCHVYAVLSISMCTSELFICWLWITASDYDLETGEWWGGQTPWPE